MTITLPTGKKVFEEWEKSHTWTYSDEPTPPPKEEPYYKVIVTNHIVEIYKMDKQPFIDDRNGDGSEFYDVGLLARTESVRDEAVQQMRDEMFEERIRKIDRKKERRSQTLRDARNKCRRLAIANFNEDSLFITLTYAYHETNVEVADEHFKRFINDRFRKKFGKFKYIAVREFQRSGRIHYHMICDAEIEWENEEELRYLEQYFGLADDVEAREVKETEKRNKNRLWGFGWVDIQRMNKTKKEGKNVDNVGAYLTKYMSKEFDDSRLKGKKAYLPSRGLDQPVVYKGTQYDESIKMILENFEQKKETFTNSYENEYLGKIVYKEYNLKRGKKKAN